MDVHGDIVNKRKQQQIDSNTMVRKCLGCGKSGHRLEGCVSKAAAEIRRLRALLESRHRDNARNNPGRLTAKRGKKKVAARQAYTRRTVKKTYLEKRSADSQKTWTAFRKHIQKIAEDPAASWKRLKKD